MLAPPIIALAVDDHPHSFRIRKAGKLRNHGIEHQQHVGTLLLQVPEQFQLFWSESRTGMLSAQQTDTVLRQTLSAFFRTSAKLVQQSFRHLHVQQFRGNPLPDAQPCLVPVQHLLNQVHAMGIQLVADKQVVPLSADGLVHLESGGVSHPYPEVHLALPVCLICPQVADHHGFPSELGVPLVIPQ